MTARAFGQDSHNLPAFASEDIARWKRAAAESAARLVTPGMRLGLGTGSTVQPFLEAIASIPGLSGTATSAATEQRARELGIQISGLGGRYDLYVDGADQVSPALDLVKGGGGAHVREKLVATLARRRVIICDASKVVDALHGPVPVAVVPFAAGLYDGCRAQLDDNGLTICDVASGDIEHPLGWDRAARRMPGVVATGIFLGRWLERVIIAGPGGIEQRRPTGTPRPIG